jgi:Tfp pilus assembly protein PilF
MGMSFAQANIQNSSADFSGYHLVKDAFRQLTYHPFTKNGKLFVTEFRLKGKDTAFSLTQQIDYIIGSGQHTNSHLVNRNGFVYQAPITWYAQKRQWDLPPGFENGRNVRFTRYISDECMTCHNAIPQMVNGSLNEYVSIPQGINCERCHGPGEVHVKQMLSGNRNDTSHGKIDYSIVNPRKLPFDLQIDLCQRCHLQGNAVLKEGKTFFSFRPGMRLKDVWDVYMPRYEGKEDEFIMASHAQRLQMSKCFITSQSRSASLTCITCHNPHVSVKVTGKQVFNNACMKCHTDKPCKEKEAVRQVSQNNCYQCHMPKSGTIDIPHVTVTDHFIRINTKSSKPNEQGRFLGLYSINNLHPSAVSKTEAYLNYVEKFEASPSLLDSVSYYLKQLPESEKRMALQIRYLFLRKDDASIAILMKQISARKINDGWLCYQTGQAFQNVGDLAKANEWYERANFLLPRYLDICNKNASVKIGLGKNDQAIEMLKQSLQLNPMQADALTNLGFAYMQSGQTAKALHYYDAALAIDPDMEQALMNKAAVFILSGKKQQARQIATRVLQLNPSNEIAKQLSK